MIWYPLAKAAAVLSLMSDSDMKSIYASINGPGASSGILDRPSLCVGVPAWDSDDEIGDRSGLELEVTSSNSYYEVSDKVLLHPTGGVATLNCVAENLCFCPRYVQT